MTYQTPFQFLISLESLPDCKISAKFAFNSKKQKFEILTWCFCNPAPVSISSLVSYNNFLEVAREITTLVDRHIALYENHAWEHYYEMSKEE